MSKLRIAAVSLVAAVSIVASYYIPKYSRHGSRIAVLDDLGLCWIGTGEVTTRGARIYSNGGTLEFYQPAMVYVFHEHVSDATLSSILRINVKHCTRVLKND